MCARVVSSLAAALPAVQLLLIDLENVANFKRVPPFRATPLMQAAIYRHVPCRRPAAGPCCIACCHVQSPPVLASCRCSAWSASPLSPPWTSGGRRRTRKPRPRPLTWCMQGASRTTSLSWWRTATRGREGGMSVCIGSALCGSVRVHMDLGAVGRYHRRLRAAAARGYTPCWVPSWSAS